MENGLLPIGSVVMLKNSTKRVMIIGLLLKQLNDESGAGGIWDYAGCLYPEGYLGPDKTFLFNNEQIETLYAEGYQDEEQAAFKLRADTARAEILAGLAKNE